MKIVVTPPLTPPLKASNSLWVRIGSCSGNFTSTSVLPLPIKAGPQALRAAALVLDCSSPEVQVGIPATSMLPCLSPSMTNSRRAGGCGSSGSSEAIFAATLKLIGVGFFFDSAFGEKPPLYCTSRLPTRTFSQLPAARATPATTSTNAAATAANLVDIPQSFFITTSHRRAYDQLLRSQFDSAVLCHGR